MSVLVNPGFDFRSFLEKFEARFLSRVYEITPWKSITQTNLFFVPKILKSYTSWNPLSPTPSQ